MGDFYDYYDADVWEEEERPPDVKQADAREAIRRFVDAHRGQVFYSRQLQVLLERDYFHWITHRAMQDLITEGYLRTEDRRLKFGGTMKLLWHHKDRNVRRELNNVAALVEEFSDPSVSESLGWVGEQLVLEAFVRNKFLLEAREAKVYGGVAWTETGHDLDFIFSRDGVSYGVEVKNKLGYIDDREFRTKMRLAQHIGVRPVFACRMLPTIWTSELIHAGGYAMILEWHLFPLTLRDLARRIREQFGTKADAPKALAQGTMDRFLKWHARNVG